MSNLAIKEVEFNNSKLIAAQEKETKKIYVGISWVCNGLGFNRTQIDSQIDKIKTEYVLKQGYRKFPVGVFDPNNETLALELDFLPLWLAKISITPNMQKTNPELVERLIEYQLKAKDVLAEAFIDNQFRHKDLPFDFNFIKSAMENVQQSITSNNKLLDTVVNTQSDIVRLSNSVIDLTKYIQQKENQQSHTPNANKKKPTQKPKNNVYEITDKYYEDLRSLAETETGYIGDAYVDKIKKLFDRLKGRRISMIFNISDEIAFEKFDFEFHEAVDYGTVKSFAYFVMKCTKTRTRKRIFVCDIREIKGQRIYLMDSSQVYKFRKKRMQG